MSGNTKDWTADKFQPFVQRGLERWSKGDLFMSDGLTEDEPIIRDGETDAPKKNEKKHPFNKLMQVVAKDLVEEQGLDKKSRKTVLKQLQQFNDEWVQMIQNHNSGNSPSSPSIKKEEGKEAVVQEETVEDENDDELSSVPQKLRTKSRATQRKIDQRSAMFAQHKGEIIKDIPSRVKERFGQVYFTKWSKDILPCLVMSPFAVPPGPVRDMWYAMHQKVKDQNRLSNMTNLVYWYGAYNDPDNAYSFLTTSKLISYEAGMKKGYQNLPKAVQKKLDADSKLTGGQDLLRRGLEEMVEDLKKDAFDRRGVMPSFPEVYDIDTDIEEDFADDDDDDEELLDDEPVEEEEPKPKKSKKKKKKEEEKPKGKAKAKKRKSVTAPMEEEEPQPKKAKKVGKKKKKVEDIPEAETPAETPADPPAESAPVEAVPTKLNIDEIGDDDLSSHDDKVDVDIEPETESDDDEEFQEVTSSKKSKAKAAKKPVGSKKVQPKKKQVKVKTKLEKKRKAKKAPTQEKLKKAEQQKFEECERQFLPLVNRWEDAIDKENLSTLNEVYQELLKSLGQFSCPFMEAYNISPLMAQSKAIHNTPERRTLMGALRVHYTEKKPEVPVGFKPKKRKPEVEVNPTKTKTKEIKEENTESTKDKSDGEDPPGDTKEAQESSQETKSSNVISTPMKRIGSLERVVSDQDTSSKKKQETPAPVKVEKKKKFSLGSLMRPASSTAAKSFTKSIPGRVAAAPSQQSKQQKMPIWISEPTLGENPADKNRSFALEFYKQAAPFVPHQKHVNHDAIARALEAATFEWAKATFPDWVDKYWEKTHDLVASISGNKEAGTLATLIADGRFKSPDEIVRLSDDHILASFEGRPVIM